MTAKPLEHFPAILAHAGEPTLSRGHICHRSVTETAWSIALWTDNHDVRDVNRSFLLHNTTLRVLLRRPRVTLDDIHSLDDDARFLGEHFEHFPALSNGIPRNHNNAIVFSDLHLSSLKIDVKPLPAPVTRSS